VLLTLAVSGSAPDPGNDGFGRYASPGPPPSPGISLELSDATTFAPLPGSTRCNSAGGLVGDESGARTLSADNTAFVVEGLIASAARPLAFRVGW
jgi:hypothetical protein